MLTTRQAQDEVKLWTYKPGYRLHLDTTAGVTHGHFILHLLADVPNTYRPDVTRLLDYRQPIPQYALRDADIFGDWLRTFLGQFECHERDEWMLRDGVRVYDPHADRDWTPPILRSNA